MNDLKPCPFCGRTDTLHFDRYQSNGEWWGFIECTECIMTGPVGKLKIDAVDAWNRRAEPVTSPLLTKKWKRQHMRGEQDEH